MIDNHHRCHHHFHHRRWHRPHHHYHYHSHYYHRHSHRQHPHYNHYHYHHHHNRVTVWIECRESMDSRTTRREGEETVGRVAEAVDRGATDTWAEAATSSEWWSSQQDHWQLIRLDVWRSKYCDEGPTAAIIGGVSVREDLQWQGYQ